MPALKQKPLSDHGIIGRSLTLHKAYVIAHVAHGTYLDIKDWRDLDWRATPSDDTVCRKGVNAAMLDALQLVEEIIDAMKTSLESGDATKLGRQLGGDGSAGLAGSDKKVWGKKYL